MAKFELTYNGQRYEVEAPDEQSALDAFQSQIVNAGPSAQERYDSALSSVRESQFPGFSDEQWSEYSSRAFSPQNPLDVARNAQIFNLGDEISAGVGAFGSQVRNWFGDQSAPGFGDAYSQYSELEQARRDLGRENMGEPVAIASEVLGGATAIGPGSSMVAQALAGAPSTSIIPGRIQSVASGALSGGVLGGLYGFGSADEDRLQSGLIGLGTGAGVGAVAPLAVEAATGGVNAVRNWAANRAAASQAGVSPQAMSILRQAVEPDLAAGGQQSIQAAGREAMLLDAGPTSQQAADYLMRVPGQSNSIMSTALTDRAGRDATALTDALNLYLGDPQGVATMRRNIATSTAAERDAAYRAAYNSPIDYSTPQGMAIEDILLNRVDQGVINAANAQMRREGVRSRQIMATVADDGSITYQTMPDVQQIDYITRALNDRAMANAGLGAMGGQTAEGLSFQNLSRDLRGATREAVPNYATALETAADPIGRSQATQFGYDLLGANVPRDRVAMQAAGMTGPEREAAALGIRSRIDETLANVRRAITTGVPDEIQQSSRAMQDLTRPAVREKIGLIIGDQDAALLFDEIDRIFVSLSREALRRTGSQTAGRQFMGELFGNVQDGSGVISTLGQGRPLNAGQRAIQVLTGMTPESLAARNQAINSEVARALSSQGADLQSNLATISGLSNRVNANDLVARALAERLYPAAGAAVYPSTILLTGN